MKKINHFHQNSIYLIFTLCILSTAQAQEQEAKQILANTGISGGLVVHLGCGDGKLTAALRANDRYLVHGLDSDPKNVEKAREYISSLGRYGHVSVEHWNNSKLPYADNLVNLIVCENLDSVPLSEVMRVLVPNGTAYIKQAGQWTKKTKPRPQNIDEWTHFLYDASNNAVSQDSVVGPPRHMQWVGEPKSARGHESLGSLSIAVSANGRLFDIADEGPIASGSLPPEWRLAARDAFNGMLLWKKPIPKWEWHLRPFRSGPPQLHRRLVAIGDTVYVTLGYGESLTALNAATGNFIREYHGTEGTEEIIYKDGILYLVVGNPQDQIKVDAAVRRGVPLPAVKRHVMAVNAATGKVLWKSSDSKLPEIFPLTLTVDNGRLFYQTTEEIIALKASNGEPLWRTSRPANLKRRSWASPTLVAYNDVVFSADQALRQEADTQQPQPVEWEVTLAGGGKTGEIVALSAKTGEHIWSAPCQQTYNAPPDVFITDGLLWTGNLIKAKEPGITQALDLTTGQVKLEQPADQDFFNVGMGHHRCYRNKATCRYLVLGRSGVEFQDLKTGETQAHHWVRGTCQHGVVPCNGLIYIPPHTCGCFIKAKLNGFNVLAPAGISTGLDISTKRLEIGPAYGKLKIQNSKLKTNDDWPTYRHDATRSGNIQTAISTDHILPRWKALIGGKLSSVVVAEGKVFVAQIDAHKVHAIDAANGSPVWSFSTGGRVDSPPTIYRGMVIFGCADGWVYCLQAKDGQLAWRFRAAPGERRVFSYGQLESAWPVSGSVLVLDNVVYCAAGRSSYLDGGIRLCRIDASTGELMSETLLSGYDEQTGKTIEAAIRVRGTEMPGALPDVLSSDGEFVFMRHNKFDRSGVKKEDEPTPHLFSSVGFLDDTWWHRTYWLWGTDVRSGWGGWWRVGNLVPAGRLLVFDDDTIYGFGRNFMPSGNAYQWRKGEAYRYFAAPKQFDPPKPPKASKTKNKRRSQIGVDRSIVPAKWSKAAEVEARAMVMAGSTLFAAGPLGPTHESTAAFEGKNGIRLRAISINDGTQLAEIELDAMPVFDGMAAAGGCLYLSMKDGSLLCLGEADRSVSKN